MSKVVVDVFTGEATCKEPVIKEEDWSKVWDKTNTICAKHIIDNLLFGLELTDSKGNPFPKEMFVQHMNSAIASIQRQLGITIPKTEILQEAHDYIATDFVNWGFIKLNEKPIRKVSRITMNFANTVLEIPKEWIRFDKNSGCIRLFPQASTPGSLAILADGTILGIGRWANAPGVWRVDYEVGFEPDEIPPDLLECIQKVAAMNLLNVWGDLILGAGIASSSVSLDGLSQSIGTTQSAMYGGASARVNEYKENVANLLAILKQYYTGIQMVVI